MSEKDGRLPSIEDIIPILLASGILGNSRESGGIIRIVVCEHVKGLDEFEKKVVDIVDAFNNNAEKSVILNSISNATDDWITITGGSEIVDYIQKNRSSVCPACLGRLQRNIYTLDALKKAAKSLKK